ncbi:hypothetical protein [Phenylobacterium sp.]|uniref:hypothetical protein n=1 Tax=Phenylobacterium sp. TaxID=1871053 RepID=UPI0035643266
MIGFRSKLREFVANWVTVAEAAPAAGASALTFIFNADDSPRLWAEDAAAFWPPVSGAGPQKEFPRFANIATHQGERLAA